MTRLAVLVANVVAASPLWSPRVRGRLLRLCGVDVRGSIRVYPWIRFLNGIPPLRIGRGTFINANLTVGDNAAITIGERVHVGPGVQLLPTTHRLGSARQRAGTTTSAPISIGDGAWVGAGAIVLGGVSIGAGAVIAAGAVVTHDCAPDGVYGGTPATLIRKLEDAPDVSATDVAVTDQDLEEPTAQE